MSNNVFIIAFGTFGNPNGFKQTYFYPQTNHNIKGFNTFDLNTNAIQLFPDNTVYAIRKEAANGHNLIAYSIYTFAKEQNSTRGGTFIGSSIVFVDKIADENRTIECLNEFHDDLKSKNVQDGVIVVKHSDQFKVKKPTGLDKIKSHLKKIDNLDFAQSSNKSLVVFCDINTPENLQDLFNKSMSLLNVYDTIYFTDSKEVAKFVLQKGLFRLIQNVGDKKEFDGELQKLEEAKQRKTQELSDELVSAKQKLEEDKKRRIEEFKKQIEQDERQHLENGRKIEEAKKNQAKIIQDDEQYAKVLDDMKHKLQSENNVNEINRLYQQWKQSFIDQMNQTGRQIPISAISVTSPRTSIEMAQSSVQKDFAYNHDNRNEPKQESTRLYLVAVLVLVLLLIGTLTYFLAVEIPAMNADFDRRLEQQENNFEEEKDKQMQEDKGKEESQKKSDSAQNATRNQPKTAVESPKEDKPKTPNKPKNTPQKPDKKGKPAAKSPAKATPQKNKENNKGNDKPRKEQSKPAVTEKKK